MRLQWRSKKKMDMQSRKVESRWPRNHNCREDVGKSKARIHLVWKRILRAEKIVLSGVFKIKGREKNNDTSCSIELSRIFYKFKTVNRDKRILQLIFRRQEEDMYYFRQLWSTRIWESGYLNQFKSSWWNELSPRVLRKLEFGNSYIWLVHCMELWANSFPVFLFMSSMAMFKIFLSEEWKVPIQSINPSMLCEISRRHFMGSFHISDKKALKYQFTTSYIHCNR